MNKVFLIAGIVIIALFVSVFAHELTHWALAGGKGNICVGYCVLPNGQTTGFFGQRLNWSVGAVYDIPTGTSKAAYDETLPLIMNFVSLLPIMLIARFTLIKPKSGGKKWRETQLHPPLFFFLYVEKEGSLKAKEKNKYKLIPIS